MPSVYKADIVLFEFLGTSENGPFRGLQTIRLVTEAEGLTLHSFTPDEPVDIVNITTGEIQTIDFADAIGPNDAAVPGSTVLLELTDIDDYPSTGFDDIDAATLLLPITGPALPPPELSDFRDGYLGRFDLAPLSYEPGTREPVTEGPFGAGQFLRFDEIDGFAYLGESGESLLEGSEAARIDRAQSIALLYEAALDRDGAIDEAGLNFWIDRAGEGLTDEAIAAFFLESDEFAARFGDPDTLSDEAYVTTLYDNVLNRAPDADGFAFWSAVLADSGNDRNALLRAFAESAENRANAPVVDALAETEPGIWEFLV
ncbi:MAG: DUF4214 domain-containing protein [Pseudomonadota bacterium]